MSFVQSSPIALLNRSSFNRVLQSSEVSATILLQYHVLELLRLSICFSFEILSMCPGVVSGFIHSAPKMSGDDIGEDGWLHVFCVPPIYCRMMSCTLSLGLNDSHRISLEQCSTEATPICYR